MGKRRGDNKRHFGGEVGRIWHLVVHRQRSCGSEQSQSFLPLGSFLNSDIFKMKITRGANLRVRQWLWFYTKASFQASVRRPEKTHLSSCSSGTQLSISGWRSVLETWIVVTDGRMVEVTQRDSMKREEQEGIPEKHKYQEMFRDSGANEWTNDKMEGKEPKRIMYQELSNQHRNQK